MKKILILSVCFVAGSVMAQGLFPELAVYSDTNNAQPAVEEERALPSIGEATVVETQAVETEAVESENVPDLFSAQDKEEVAEAETEAAAEAEEEEDDEEERQIGIFPDDVKSTIVPNNNFSFCSGTLKFVNTLAHRVKRLAVSLNYDGLVVDFDVRNLAAKNGQKSEDLVLLGTACEHILDTPEIEIKACEAEGMEPDACKKKVIFIPLR